MTVGLEGRMDAITSPEFGSRMDDWIENGFKNFFIDCSQLDYISSAGLRAILMVAKKLRSQEGDLQLAALQETVQTVFTISGFDKIISIMETLDDTVQAKS